MRFIPDLTEVFSRGGIIIYLNYCKMQNWAWLKKYLTADQDQDHR